MRLGDPRRGGFTLIEILCALVIFSVAIVAFVQAMGATVSVQADLIGRTRASMLAENILEEIQLSGIVEEDSSSGQFEGGDADYGWSTDTVETDIDGLFEITVTVTWDQGLRPGEYTLVTMMRNRVPVQ